METLQSRSEAWKEWWNEVGRAVSCNLFLLDFLAFLYMYVTYVTYICKCMYIHMVRCIYGYRGVYNRLHGYIYPPPRVTFCNLLPVSVLFAKPLSDLIPTFSSRAQ